MILLLLPLNQNICLCKMLFQILMAIIQIYKDVLCIILCGSLDEREWRRMDTYIVWLSRSAEHLKLSQHC